MPEETSFKPSLAQKCLELTGWFETGQRSPGCYGAVAGNFDNQGLSAGCLQWNIGQGTLQPLLAEFLTEYPQAAFSILGESGYAVLRAMLSWERPVQIAWAITWVGATIPDAVPAKWKDRFKALGTVPGWAAIQVKASRPYYDWALKTRQAKGLVTERAVALLFDIRVQNGSVNNTVWSQVQADMANKYALPALDWERLFLRSLANRRAEASSPKWIEDVRARKLAIAEGEGLVHGCRVNLAADFDITLKPAVDLLPAGEGPGPL